MLLFVGVWCAASGVSRLAGAVVSKNDVHLVVAAVDITAAVFAFIAYAR